MISDQDCVFFCQISDTIDRTQLCLDFIVLNNPDTERFDTDVDMMGKDTLFGRASRNISEEIGALKAGLFPGQVRRGLGLTGQFINCLEHFARILGIKSIVLDALFYHNAISYERHGFSYFEGFLRMKRIHELFEPGNILHDKLNGSSPFRQAGFHRTIYGRSWAIHDGILNDIDDEILEGAWFSPKMYKMIDKPRKICTFPNVQC
ncbi:MAG: histone deacetylase [bacterium]|nr:MAG: histone deacetylase [bacterium]